MVGKEQVAAIVAESLQGIDHLGRREARQVLPTLGKSHAVAHHPAGSKLLDIQFVNLRSGDDLAGSGGHVVLLEPGDSILLVGRTRGIVVRNEHGQQAALAGLVGDIETDGLSLGHRTIGKASLHGVGHIHVRRCLLDEVTGRGTRQFGDVIVVLDNLDSHNVTSGIRPAQRQLTTALRNISL